MAKQKDIYRETWSANGKYLIRAYAKISDELVTARVYRTLGVVQVFDGDPGLTGNPEIFISSSRLNGVDLLDELQNAEKIGRNFIATLV